MKILRFLIYIFVLFVSLQSKAFIPFAFWRQQNQFDPSWTPQWSSLKAYWNFNGGLGAIASGATLVDYFGTSNGTASAAGMSYVDGKLSQGVSFDGTAYFSVSRTSPANVCTAMTWTTWVKWNAPASPGWVNLIANWNGCGTDASWNVNQAGGTQKIQVAFNTTAAFNQWVGSTATPLDGIWHHIAVTLTAAGAATVYIDGVQDGTLAVNMGAGICSPATNLFIAGGTSCGGVIGSGALLDEMAIWNTALTAAEISSIYNRQKNGF